ncbi:hypothetical protein ECC02_013674 [Trypanosoma cruzi]|uniref:Uncharacterized protein n=1 Tax=Trypanosoma cruzi TaxID=5693 RepID=A0A7J6XGR1_TRYCR|nr:hypothetical protein ECC02_013674 [Trypanosoma cruzi]
MALSGTAVSQKYAITNKKAGDHPAGTSSLLKPTWNRQKKGAIIENKDPPPPNRKSIKKKRDPIFCPYCRGWPPQGIKKSRAVAPDERYMTTCRIIQVAAAAPDERYMTTNRCIHAAATAPYEIYDDESKYLRWVAAAPYERYMTTNRGIHAAAAHPKHVAFVFQGTTQMCSIVRRSNLTPYVKMGRATTFFLAQWQNKLTISSGVRVRAPKKPKFFPFFFGILVSYCFLNFWFAGRCASSAIALIPSVSWCVRLRLRWWPRASE